MHTARNQNSQVEKEIVSSGGACFQNWFPGPQSLLGSSSQECRGDWPFFSGRVTACIPFTVPVTVLVAPQTRESERSDFSQQSGRKIAVPKMQTRQSPERS